MVGSNGTGAAVKAESRAVLRRIEAGHTHGCAHCDKPVKFKAKSTNFKVVANVYIDGKWDRVEQYHQVCYGNAGEPYGKAKET